MLCYISDLLNLLENHDNELPRADLDQFSSGLSESQTLCLRCSQLRLDDYMLWEGRIGLDKYSHIADIHWDSIRNDCSLCLQFAEICNTYFAHWQLDNDACRSFSLSCRSLYGTFRGQQDVCGSVLRTYFVIESWDDAEENVNLCPTYIQTGYDFRNLGRVVDPNKINMDEALRWLEICQTTHPGRCARSPNLKSSLWVIDCVARRLVLAIPEQQFVCLSYVWGGEAPREQAFGVIIPDDIPKTIEDAMLVAVTLKIPYLWVDRYCIDQSNPTEKHNVIQNMGNIYQAAVLTIIAAAGDNPHHGLPGIRGTRRRQQQTLRVSGQLFVVAENQQDLIRGSVWYSRGWTYQEMLLSRRCLVFTESQVYFQCRDEHCMESLCSSMTEPEAPLSRVFAVFPIGGVPSNSGDLIRCLQEYCKRDISFPTDILDAFEGVIHAYNEERASPQEFAKHFYGIPIFRIEDTNDQITQSFLSHLAWTNATCLAPTKRTNTFPSWSWASIKADWPTAKFKLRYRNRRYEQNGMVPLPSSFINVRVVHQILGPLDMPEFALRDSDYTHFKPFLDITTWSFCYASDAYHEKDRIAMDADEEEKKVIFDATIPDPQPELLIVYLGINCTITFDLGLSFQHFALLVEEVAPGVCSRRGLWRRAISDDLENMVSCESVVLDMFDDMEKEDASGQRWTRRTLRLV